MPSVIGFLHRTYSSIPPPQVCQCCEICRWDCRIPDTHPLFSFGLVICALESEVTLVLKEHLFSPVLFVWLALLRHPVRMTPRYLLYRMWRGSWFSSDPPGKCRLSRVYLRPRLILPTVFQDSSVSSINLLKIGLPVIQLFHAYGQNDLNGHCARLQTCLKSEEMRILYATVMSVRLPTVRLCYRWIKPITKYAQKVFMLSCEVVKNVRSKWRLKWVDSVL
jgi:hypothetical protein